MASEKKEEEPKKEIVYYSSTIRAKRMPADEIAKLNVAFQSMVACCSMNQILDEISANKKAKDAAQKARLEEAMALIKSGIPMPAFPGKVMDKLKKGIKKQIKSCA